MRQRERKESHIVTVINIDAFGQEQRQERRRSIARNENQRSFTPLEKEKSSGEVVKVTTHNIRKVNICSFLD